MNWEYLKVFLAVACEGSALAASRSLNVNHSTVIRRINQLEEELDAKLFSRHQSGYQLTSNGQHVLAAAKKMEEGALSLVRKVKGKESQLAGTLIISKPESALFDFSNLFFEFSKLHPEIELHLINTPEISNLNKSEANIAIRLTDTPPDLLVGREVAKAQFSVYAHKQYLRRFNQLPIAEECDWLLWTGARSTTVPEANHPDELLQSSLANARVALRTNSMEDIVAGIRSGIGVGLLSHQTGHSDDNLVELPYQSLVKSLNCESVGLWLLTHRDMRDNAMIKEFFAFFTNNWHQ